MPKDPTNEHSRRTLDNKAKETLREQLSNSALDIPESFFKGKSYDELLTEALVEDYERLNDE